MLLHHVLSLVHHIQELVYVDQALTILVRHLDHLLYLTVSNIYSQLPQNSLKIIPTYFTVTVRILQLFHCLVYWVMADQKITITLKAFLSSSCLSELQEVLE